MTATVTQTIGLTDVEVRFGRTIALHDVTFALDAGSVTGLIGGDGSGKSTTLRVLAGTVRSRNGSATRLSAADVGYQPSDSGTWRNLTVQENINFVGHVRGISAATLRERAKDMLQRAGLDHARDRLARDLSGGMRQKLGFILATIHRPRLVLLDEPTTGVDPVSRADLWDLVSDAAADGASIAMATTYLDEAERCARVLLFDRGELLADDTPEGVAASAPGSLYVSAPGEKLPNDGDTVWWRRGMQMFGWSPVALPPSEYYEGSSADLENAAVAYALDATRRHAPESYERFRRDADLPSSAGGVGSSVLVAATDITRKFGSFQALKGVDLSVATGEVVGLLGGNGAGKTTLIRVILGLTRPTSGAVQLFGEDESTLAARRRIGYVAQGIGLYTGLTAAENVRFVGQVFRADVDEDIKGLDPRIASTVVHVLPLGEQRNVAVLAATSHDPELLVLDEPTSGMDRLGSVALWSRARQHADRGAGVLITTHDMREAEQCDRLVLMVQGEVVGVGTRDELLAGREVIGVETPDWQKALSALRASGLHVSLHGRQCRVVPDETHDEDVVRAILEEAGVESVDIRRRPASLQEVMVHAQLAGVAVEAD
ncbi:ATP-binding cassette domain-containing protein [Microbacterium amylolyticum]|uniref:ABC-2 type transport system ATP-binding protein n=1 Tax=Microbacterium amylolyticum TaxID=936337 RepID=A0ABS4ZI85_9MICO|nr:ATP-binding cassette domain-containing protein [Microbacterium amylolyticum]MBP2436710.1 ABC-2 type transport system ATP-binding protein [Microbacterium amylolyticum]